MIAEFLEPRLDLLSQEYVLVQAWKKTASYIRYHNWYSDTLALDRASADLPRFLAEISEQLKSPDHWNNDPLRIVFAPKSQQWHVDSKSNRWKPVHVGEAKSKLRPLAHVALKDQVVATAVMLCLADRVETLQGDPRDSIGDAKKRRRVISYGNRLFCDANNGGLRHRWGSAKLYRAYYQDYRRFLARPGLVAKSIDSTEDTRVTIVHSDLRQFYDRVRPDMLAEKLSALRWNGDDSAFFELTSRLLNWEWHKKDVRAVATFAKQVDLTNFKSIALPQGLVAAGFFANVTLLDFDDGLRAAISTEIQPGIRVEDVCRYVDDLRIVLNVDRNTSLEEVEAAATSWLRKLLEHHAKGLQASEEKTQAAAFMGTEQPLVRQNQTMERIQGAISGGFDAIGGTQILDAVEGLMRSQERYSEQRDDFQAWPLSPIPDVRDATVARFAAGRFRSTYRSLRPLLADGEMVKIAGKNDAGDEPEERSRRTLTQSELDDKTRAFALGLIENWGRDPSNVRLLRIGLDLWPAEDVLREILKLLRPFTESGPQRKTSRSVAWYCLAEIFRAGATETGFVNDGDCLPSGIDITAYRSLLREEANRLAALPASLVPWYLFQQVLLFLVASDPTDAQPATIRHIAETSHYQQLTRFLQAHDEKMADREFATLAVVARRSFLSEELAVRLVSRDITNRRLEQIAERDPSFALEILKAHPGLWSKTSPRLRSDLSSPSAVQEDGRATLMEVVLSGGPRGPLRNELSLLSFASQVLGALSARETANVVTPTHVVLMLSSKDGAISNVGIVANKSASPQSMYCPPTWCPADQRWRFQVGYLLRFILAAKPDFTEVVRPPHWKEGAQIYRVPKNHWYEKRYGMFNGHSAFGDDWLPISDWIERLLLALLKWPGCRSSRTGETISECVDAGIGKTRQLIDRRYEELMSKQGPASKVLMIPRIAPSPIKQVLSRPLRACVMQLVTPTPTDYWESHKQNDLILANPDIRKRHRNHLSAALAAIERMLDLRETHKGRDGRLDWLILPELSVHPQDVKTHLVPFARTHKTIILAGLVYEELFVGEPLVNSALWVIPELSEEYGLQTRVFRQGKQHLAPPEQKLDKDGTILQGFRPCQWLIGYDWSSDEVPLWLTGSICYDATDLALVADLRDLSDIYAIPALNVDVSTFDQMAQSLHYHMFQLVIVANNGEYGGSNAYMPYRAAYRRQVFHLHGQPQASVAFLEIDDIGEFLRRQTDARKALNEEKPKKPPEENKWKFPPAGL